MVVQVIAVGNYKFLNGQGMKRNKYGKKGETLSLKKTVS